MSETQGDRPVSRKAQVIGVTAALALLAGAGAGVGVAVHNAQVHADAVHAMTVAAPAYQGAISLGGNLDQLSVQSVQAKAAYDVEQARIAAEQAAQAAAAQKAAEEAAQKAKEVAAQQETQQQATQSGTSTNDAPSNDAPVTCPSGTIAQAVDANGNESNCQPLGPTGTQCVAYDANNQCTAWLEN
jgi:hypothetical protein